MHCNKKSLNVTFLFKTLFFSRKMEKNIGFSAANAQPSSLLPTAPPSYEEAIANTGALNTPMPMNPPVGSAPYPLGTTPVPMPMPCTYIF